MKVCKCPYVDENSEHLPGCVHSQSPDVTTLRDQFAMAALTSIVQSANMIDVNDFPKRFARFAYGLADAMLEARKVKPLDLNPPPRGESGMVCGKCNATETCFNCGPFRRR